MADHHASETEVLVRLFKVHARDRGLTYSDALDEALCFGWIDGVRRGGDEDTFTIRFTPRKPKSTWSAVNIKRVAELAAAGRMHESGLAAFKRRSSERSEIYAYENRQTQLRPNYEKKFRSNKRAWQFFEAQAPWYRRTSIYWVMSAKKEETRERRLASLIQVSAKGKPLPQLDRSKT
ncbi:MAG: YdeI/OmpD-associated family protein [Gemmatimonadaceae bacterium]